jgi:hypothetical protein
LTGFATADADTHDGRIQSEGVEEGKWRRIQLTLAIETHNSGQSGAGRR